MWGSQSPHEVDQSHDQGRGGMAAPHDSHGELYAHYLFISVALFKTKLQSPKQNTPLPKNSAFWGSAHMTAEKCHQHVHKELLGFTAKNFKKKKILYLFSC